MKVYLYKGCSSCQKATRWLDAAAVQYEALPIRETPPSEPELKQMLSYQGGVIKKLFNVAGGDYRELNMKERLPEMSEAEAIQLLASRGNLVKRPFLISDDFGLVGFKEAEWSAQFGK